MLQTVFARLPPASSTLTPRQDRNRKAVRHLGPLRATDDDLDVPRTSRNQLELTIRRKSRQLEGQLKELGDEGIEERMQSSLQSPAQNSYRLTRLIADLTMQGRAALVFEISRPSPSSPLEDLAKLAKQYAACGADALAVGIDAEDTPEGLKDLLTVCTSVRIPVLSRDWVIHPLQVVESKEAGASGVLGVINQVNGRGTAVLSSFAAGIGIDAPVEVVNLQEVEALSRLGVSFFGINLAVGLSVALPGFSSQIADGLLGQLPFGCISLVGVRTLEEARNARLSGADALLIKKELIEAEGKGDLKGLIDRLMYATCNDD